MTSHRKPLPAPTFPTNDGIRRARNALGYVEGDNRSAPQLAQPAVPFISTIPVATTDRSALEVHSYLHSPKTGFDNANHDVARSHHITKAASEEGLQRSFTSSSTLSVATSSPSQYPMPATLSTASLLSADGENTTSKTRPKIVTALEDASVFLGGLIKHPVESNRHFSTLRHSNGIVFYKGPDTSLALSVFSDRSLPSDRRLWLQLKGWTGNIGMAAKGLFRFNNDWINVTPVQQVRVTDLLPLDERAWQRDIGKFMKKADSMQRKHVLRETVVVRIPYEATDGYFRVVFTGADSKSILCYSSVFRVASTSMSASSLKGASLSTIPLELGVKAAQTAATTFATAAAGPWAVVAKNRVKKAAPVLKYGPLAQTAWDASGGQARLDAVNESYSQRRADGISKVGLNRTWSAPAATMGRIGHDTGPDSPYPIEIDGIICRGSGESFRRIGRRTANVDNLPPDQLAGIPVGVYFGWATIRHEEKPQHLVHSAWHQAVVTVIHAASKAAEVAPPKKIRADILHDFGSITDFTGRRLKVLVMGYLRPTISLSEHEVLLLETMNDIAITAASLSRPAWHWADIALRLKEKEKEITLTDRLVDLRLAGQNQIDRVPIHVVGVRNDSFGVHDRNTYGIGGFWVKRD